MSTTPANGDTCLGARCCVYAQLQLLQCVGISSGCTAKGAGQSGEGRCNGWPKDSIAHCTQLLFPTCRWHLLLLPCPQDVCQNTINATARYGTWGYLVDQDQARLAAAADLDINSAAAQLTTGATTMGSAKLGSGAADASPSVLLLLVVSALVVLWGRHAVGYEL